MGFSLVDAADQCVLKAGNSNYNKHVVILEKGERVIGIKSRVKDVD